MIVETHQPLIRRGTKSLSRRRNTFRERRFKEGGGAPRASLRGWRETERERERERDRRMKKEVREVCAYYGKRNVRQSEVSRRVVSCRVVSCRVTATPRAREAARVRLQLRVWLGLARGGEKRRPPAAVILYRSMRHLS